jgi:hypothetical protein
VILLVLLCVLRVKALKRKEKYKQFIIDTLVALKTELNYECAIFDRGFYNGKLLDSLDKNCVPFIVRARISATIKKIFGFSTKWKSYPNAKIGKTQTQSNLILGADYTGGKRTKWAFITNIKYRQLNRVREIYRKRWNIENIFKATDGIQLRVQTNNPTTRMFCVCMSFLFYNSWQQKKNIGILHFIQQILEKLFNEICDKITYYRDKLKINMPFWNIIINA